MKAALLALAAVVAVPSVSYACMNGVAWTVDDDIRVITSAEKLFDQGRYGKVLDRLRGIHPPRATLRARMADLRSMIKIRVHKPSEDISAAVVHIEKRDDEAKGKDVKFRAWRAEAYVAIGKRDEAHAILADLHARDLVPDEFAYLALAKVSTGAARLEMWKACRTRAKNKELCELPAENVSARKAPTR